MFQKRPLPAPATPKKVPATITPKQRYEANRAHFANLEVRAENQQAWQAASRGMEVNNPSRLGRTLSAITPYQPAMVKNIATGEINAVYEIPVDGLIFQTEEVDFPLNPQTTVLVYSIQEDYGQFLDREILEDPQFFEFVAP